MGGGCRVLEIRLSPGQAEYLQIAEQVTMAVATGQVQPGDRLAPVRELARRLGLNASTVARAYRLLELQGVIETHKRRGSLVRVNDQAAGLQELRRTRLRSLMERSLVEALGQGYAPEEIEATFGAQLAAWRERRRPAAVAQAPASDSGRLYRFAGSHDLALEALWAQARRAHPEAAFSASYIGSLDGLLRLLHGEVGLAGTHILDEETGAYNIPILRRLFVGQPLCIVTVAEREQGLMVAPHNPKDIRSLHDIARPGVRFANRQSGSGTRTLLDYHLRRLQVSAADVQGYQHELATHLAVAAAVSRGVADAGLGLQAAAQAFGLDFLPLVRERYDLALLAADRERPPLAWLLNHLASAEFKTVVANLGGYDAAHTGDEVYI